MKPKLGSFICFEGSDAQGLLLVYSEIIPGSAEGVPLVQLAWYKVSIYSLYQVSRPQVRLF